MQAGAVKIQLWPFLTMALLEMSGQCYAWGTLPPRKEPQDVLYCCTLYYTFYCCTLYYTLYCCTLYYTLYLSSNSVLVIFHKTTRPTTLHGITQNQRLLVQF